MIDRDRLIGWLCMIRIQFGQEMPVHMPEGIRKALVAEGWVTHDPEPDWDGHRPARITDAGWTVTDLNAAEWGIDPIPVED